MPVPDRSAALWEIAVHLSRASVILRPAKNLFQRSGRRSFAPPRGVQNDSGKAGELLPWEKSKMTTIVALGDSITNAAGVGDVTEEDTYRHLVQVE